MNPVLQATAPIQFLPDIARQLGDSYRAAGRSERTIESYIETMVQFSAYLIATHGDDDPDTVTTSAVESYVGRVRLSRSAGTAKVRFATLRACWRWMLKRGFVAHDPFIGVPAPSVDQRVLKVLEDDDVRAILATCDGPGLVNRRDKAILLVLADTGCRRQDIAQARLDDFDAVTGRVIFRQRKSGRDTIAALSPTTLLAIKRYLRERARIADPATTTLFVTRTGQPMLGNGVYQALKHRYATAGVEVERAVHSFRSWAAIRMLDRGAGESEVMALLGWRSSQMLLRYQRQKNVDRALARHSSFSPVSGL